MSSDSPQDGRKRLRHLPPENGYTVNGRTLGERVRALRDEVGISQNELAYRVRSELGVSATGAGIAQNERDEHHPREELLLAIVTILGGKDSDFPELYMIRARMAIDNGQVDDAIRALRKFERARQLEEAGGPAAAAEAVRRSAPEPRPTRPAASRRRTG